MTTNCPALVKNSNIITSSDEIRLSDYSTSVGTKTTANCEGNHALNGTATLTCLPSGQWDNPKPTCYYVAPKSGNGEADAVQMEEPLLISIGVLGFLAIVFVIVLIVVNCKRGRCTCCSRSSGGSTGKAPPDDYFRSGYDDRRPDLASNASDLSAAYPPQAFAPEAPPYERERYSYDNSGYGYDSQAPPSQVTNGPGPMIGRIPRPQHDDPRGRDSLASVSYYAGGPQDKALFAPRPPQRPPHRSWQELFFANDDRRY